MTSPVNTPLAERLRPQSLADVVGQSHLVAGKAELREIIERTQMRHNDLFSTASKPDTMGSAVLFLDEIHRFNKAQQDYLLPFVEDGTLTLIGATTENPSFEVIGALLSRLQVFVLKPLDTTDLERIIRRGVEELQANITPAAMSFLAQYANGDARTSLNLLENAYRLYGRDIDTEQLKETLQAKHLRYDKGGEEHYNTIKSMRVGEVDAALYYLARMIDAGEDPKFIARRMVIFASEDVGMADPRALALANDVFRAVETIGLPEAQINLAHGVVFLATCPKDRTAYDAYFLALEDVKAHGNAEIPMFLRNAPTRLMRELGYGKGEATSYLPASLADRRYYKPKG